MIATEYGYNLLCTKELQTQLNIGVHTEPNEIEWAFSVCIDSLIKEFKEQCKKINTTNKVYYFFNFYTELCEIIEKSAIMKIDKIEKFIMAKWMCKFVFSQITGNKIISSEAIDDENNIDKLMCLTSSLYKLIQERQLYYLFDKNGIQLELLDDCCAFTLIDESYNIKPDTKWNEYVGHVSNENHIIEFQETTIQAFGTEAEDFFDIVFSQEEIIDLDTLHFEEFKYIAEKADFSRYKIINISTLYQKYPASQFLKGLTLRNKDVDLFKELNNPNSAYRVRNRPILELDINNKTTYITFPQLVFEALAELIENQIPFDNLPDEWCENIVMRNFSKKWKEQHDTWLDDMVQNVLDKHSYTYLRNIKGIDGINLEKEESVIKDRNVGEIDYIIIDNSRKIVHVVDTKFIKVKSNPASLCSDKYKFTGGKKPYDDQLFIKYEWIRCNLNHVQNELKRRQVIVDILTYKVELFFITNAPTFYSNISKYPIISIRKLIPYLEYKELINN